MKKEVILRMAVSDNEFLNSISGFQPSYSYDGEIHEREWGKIETEDAIFKFYCFDSQPERLNPEARCPTCKHSLIEDQGSQYCEGCKWRGWVARCDSLNSMETWREQSEEVAPLTSKILEIY